MRAKGLALILLVSTTLAAAPAPLSQPSAEGSAPATGREVSELQDYTQMLGKAWLKKNLDLDLDTIGFDLRRRARPFTQVEMQGVPAGPDDGAAGPSRSPVAYNQTHLLMRLEQYDDILRLSRDLSDVPVAVRLESTASIFGQFGLATSFFVPISWKDEMRAEASLPLPWSSLGLLPLDQLFGLAGLKGAWTLHSAYSNRQGASKMQMGLSTQWMKDWAMDYTLLYRYGQDSVEEIHWLKLGRSF